VSRNARAWAFLCKLFSASQQQFARSCLSRAEQALLPALQGIRAVRTYAAPEPYTRCPHCHRADVPVGPAPDAVANGVLQCHCPSCGPVPVTEEYRHRYAVDMRWLTIQLRLALSIGIGDPCEELCEGVWQLGFRGGALAVLLRDVSLLVQNAAIYFRLRLRARGRLCILAPAEGLSFGGGVLDEDVTTMALEDRFCLYGDRVMLVGRGGAAQVAETDDERGPVLGPFSRDFRWVHLDSWPHGPIALRPSQAAIFRALWKFKGKPCRAAEIMREAGLSSEKPIDVFKVRRERKGDPAHEGPMHAYQELVVTQQRLGTYAMRCAAKQDKE
jgi:hypothetical protein